MFPAHKLTASGGQISAYLSGSPDTGMPLGIYWAIRIDFDPIEYDDGSWPCSMTCSGLTWPTRDWREIAGTSRMLTRGDPPWLELGFYMWQHDTGKYGHVAIGARHGHHFDVTMDMVVDFAGLSRTDKNPSMQVRGRTTVPFIGAIVVPENFFPKPDTPARAMDAVAAFLDTALLAAPERPAASLDKEPRQRLPWSHAFRMQPLAGL